MYKEVRCIKVQSCCCFYVRGIRLFSVPFTQAREAREGKKLKLFTNFLLAFVRLWHFSGFT